MDKVGEQQLAFVIPIKCLTPIINKLLRFLQKASGQSGTYMFREESSEGALESHLFIEDGNY